MTGLDLESFLLLLRADLSAWLMLGIVSLGLALLVWVCWGSRRALRKCLVLSLAAHLGIVLFGSTVPAVQLAIHGESTDSAKQPHIRRIQVAPLVESPKQPEGGSSPAREQKPSNAGVGSATSSPRLELPAGPLRLVDVAFTPPRPAVADRSTPDPAPVPQPPIPVGTATPPPSRPLPDPPPAGPRAEPDSAKPDPLSRPRSSPPAWPPPTCPPAPCPPSRRRLVTALPALPQGA